MVVGADTVLKLKILEELRDTQELLVKELSWRLGIRPEHVVRLARDLSRNYLIELRNNRVVWSIADNPSTLKPWGWRLVHEIVIGSTMEYARGCGLWTAVVAEYQLYGRGRHGKKWIGNLGGLWITLRLPVSHGNASYIPMAAPLIVVDILRRNYGVKTMIKWPNDIIYGDKKIVGILVEAEAVYDKLIVNIGLGINVNNEPPLPGATSLKKIMGRRVPRNGLLSLLIGWFSRLNKILEEPEEIKERYIRNLATLNRRVRALTRSGVVEGFVSSVSEYGELVVETDSGKKVLDPSDTLELRHVD